MHFSVYWIRTGSLVSLLALLGACAANKIPQSSRSMAEIYAGIDAGAVPTRGINDGEADLSGYTRDAASELRVKFPRLPNPTLVLYVFPHLTAEGLPVPGYATAFDVYPSAPFALPGELTQDEVSAAHAAARSANQANATRKVPSP
jgi:conjugative transfer region lipoprotein (TIGR03751 family)